MQNEDTPRKTAARSGDRFELRGTSRLAYTPAEFAALFGRSTTWAYRLLYRGRIKRIDNTGRILIPASELERFVCALKVHE